MDVRAVILRDETESLVRVVPLDLAAGHPTHLSHSRGGDDRRGTPVTGAPDDQPTGAAPVPGATATMGRSQGSSQGVANPEPAATDARSGQGSRRGPPGRAAALS